MFYQILDVII